MDNIYGGFTPTAWAFDDDALAVAFTVGKLDVVNNNGWILASGVTGGRDQMAKLSAYNHSLGPFGSGGVPVGVTMLYEEAGELRGLATYNPNMAAARDAYQAVKFGFDNGAPDDWSYGGRPIEVDHGEEGDPPTFTLVEFFEASPVLQGAHADSRTLTAAESAKEDSMAPEGKGDGKAATEVTVRPVYEFDKDELAGTIGRVMADQLEAMRVDADKFASLEKENVDLRKRLEIIEAQPAPETLVAGREPNTGEVWAAGNHDWDAIHQEAKGGRYTAELDVDPVSLWAADVTTSTGVTGLPERVGYDFVSLGRLSLVPLIPTLPTSATSVRFQRETINSGNRPAPTAEASASPEATISYADQNRAVETIRGIIPVTDQELEDVPFMEGLISQRMGDLVEASLQAQILEGDGTSPNLTGINDTSNVQTATAAHSADIDTRALNMINAIGEAAGAIEGATDVGMADLVAMTPAHFWIIARAKDAQDRPLFSNWETGVPRSVLGIALVPCGGQDAAKQTVISRAHVELRVRRGLTVEIGLNDVDFSQFTQSVRASIRAAMVVRRPQGCAVIAAANS